MKVNAALNLICQHQGDLYAMQRVRPPLESLFVSKDHSPKDHSPKDHSSIEERS
jgi:hypothetical protein